MYAWRPASTSWRISSAICLREFTILVMIGFLPFGSSSIMVKSKSPFIVIARVLGIGVAVIVRICGFCDFFLNAKRCLTPNLCCSSITTAPRFANSMLSWIRACVPTAISASPFLRFVSDIVRCFLPILPRNNSTLRLSGVSHLIKLL